MSSILLVEDEALLRDLLSESLGEAGYTVYTAASWRTGAQLAAAYGPDLVITDLRLGETWDGLAVIAQARARDWQVPIIAMSAHSDEALRMAATAGATRTVAKPFALDRVLALVAALVPA